MKEGEIFYELSSHSSKTIDWIASLKKEEYVGTESKFKIFWSFKRTSRILQMIMLKKSSVIGG
jgi:hypothetical protein